MFSHIPRWQHLTACLLWTAFIGASALNAQSRPKIKHVLVISIDGMHSQDLTWCVHNNGCATLAQLSATAITYTNAFTTQPSDSIPGTVGVFTGASPALAGMYYDDAWHREWYKPGSACSGSPGTPIDLKEPIDVTPDALDTTLDPNKLPLDPKRCTPIYPHDMLRVNTIFEVISQNGGYTAYSEKRPSYDFLNGPSGKGVNDLYTPEIASGKLLDLNFVETFDGYRVQSILNEIDGLNHNATAAAPVPTLFGMNFQTINSAKKSDPTTCSTMPCVTPLNPSDILSGSGYDADGAPDAKLKAALKDVDTKIGLMVNELRSRGLLNNTAIIITAKHGESPLANRRAIVLTNLLGQILTPQDTTKPQYPYKKITQKSTGLIWLANQAQTRDAVAALKKGLLGLADQYGSSLTVQISWSAPLGPEGPDFSWPFPDPTKDPAPPDIVVMITDVNGSSVNFEPSYTSTTYAEHGGFGERETHVPLLISFPNWTANTVSDVVSTRQIAPSVLTLLGIDPTQLEAVRVEGITALPQL